MTSLHDRILRALDAASDTGDVLRAVGDALRASTPLPPRARAFVREVPDATLAAATRALTDALATAARGASIDPTAVDAAVLARDHAESARVALARAAIARARPPGAFDPDGSLDRALDALDEVLRERCDRARVEAALVERVSLRDVDAWLDTFADASRAVDLTHAEAPDVAPPDGVIDAWLREGRHRRWVEGYAARDRGFADELRAIVDAHEPDDGAVNLTPYAWRRSQRDATHVVVLKGARPRLRVAAATEPVEVEARTVTLSSVGAKGLGARLTCTPTRATLTLYAEPGDVTALVFGRARVEAPADANRWVAETPITDEAIPLEVVFADGERFAMKLSLPAEASP
ncbi:MAG: hypothetical protein R3A52_24010 [Polyangiales bacterium]